MAAQSAIAARHSLALKEAAEILTRHDEEAGERIRKAGNGRIPSPKNAPLEAMAYHAECMASLARLIDEHLTPKKRGRPPKAS
jgi:hypothetical protein